MSTRMSFHLLVESRDFAVLRKAVEVLFEDVDADETAVIAALQPKGRHTWLTVADGLSKGVNFYDVLSGEPPGDTRWWEFATMDGDVTFATAYAASGTERWTGKGVAGLAKAGKDAGLAGLELPDWETGELDGASDVVLRADEAWERALAKALGVPKKQLSTLPDRHAEDQEVKEDYWANVYGSPFSEGSRGKRIMATPALVLAAAPKGRLELADELDRIECLWRVGKRTEAKAAMKKLRVSGEYAERKLLDVTAPVWWKTPRERYLPDFSLALIDALPARLKKGPFQLRRLQGLAAAGDKALLPALKALFASGVPGSMSWDDEAAEAVARMKSAALKKEAKRLLGTLQKQREA